MLVTTLLHYYSVNREEFCSLSNRDACFSLRGFIKRITPSDNIFDKAEPPCITSTEYDNEGFKLKKVMSVS